jgi:hypothetical protein
MSSVFYKKKNAGVLSLKKEKNRLKTGLRQKSSTRLAWLKDNSLGQPRQAPANPGSSPRFPG